ncbi:MAG: 3-methyl-2-oxobutanoate hydroxymethyltransferase [Candidatus Aminicenantes bacterium]|nr:3-methyl-2-oxobutanoate hydroxymethyltransferase [Candidatus Aminicenantes bacterium]
MPEKTESVVTIPSLQGKKDRRERIVALTAYDFPSALILDRAGVDIVLVGDSLGMVVLGYENTIPVTMDEMIHHTKAVSRAVKRALVIGDMPYFSFHQTEELTIANASRFLKEAGARAVKVEGASDRRLGLIAAMVEAEIPVMGHVGLTPQSIHHLGHFRVRGGDEDEARKIIEDARKLEQAGVFAVILECVPEDLAGAITKTLRVPTIGIGAGPLCDGQVLVFHDLVGFSGDDHPKFVKRYADVQSVIRQAVIQYADEVRKGIFPDESHTYHPQKKAKS